MRLRVGNPFCDQHGLRSPQWTARVYDWVSRPIRPSDVPLVAEHVVPDLCLYGRTGKPYVERRWTGFGIEAQSIEMPDIDPAKRGWVNGCVHTSWTTWGEHSPDPALYIAITIYDEPCDDPKCAAGHMSLESDLPKIAIRQAPDVAPWLIEQIVEEIGEHPAYRLGAGRDAEVLTALGFTPMDAPLIGVTVTDADVYRALDALLVTSPPTWAAKVAQMDEAGFEVEFGRQLPQVWDLLPRYFALKEAV